MVEMGRENPFAPGTGAAPPYLAGRESEQALLRSLIEELRVGVPPGRFVVLYGPRGNGKTALLDWTGQLVEADEGLDGVRLTPADIPTPDDLVPRLGADTGQWRASASGTGAGALRVSGRQPLLADALGARAKARPFVVLLDEAHTIGTEVARRLLNAAQTAGSNSPFLLLFSGDDVEGRLSGLGVSFWHRAAICPVGRLGDEAVADAIRRPLASGGVVIEPAALDRIVRESDGYPYFVQLWGRAVWGRAVPGPDGGGRITVGVVEDAAGEFVRSRNRHCRMRYDELMDHDLLPAAREVALAFRGREQLSYTALDEAVRRATSADGWREAKAAARGLQRLGFVWRSENGPPAWEPGIPSLMDYILEYAPAPTV